MCALALTTAMAQQSENSATAASTEASAAPQVAEASAVDINSAENATINQMQEPQAQPQPAAQPQPESTNGGGTVQLIINVVLLVIGALGVIVAFIAKKDAANARRASKDELNALKTAFQKRSEEIESALRIVEQRLADAERTPSTREHQHSRTEPLQHKASAAPKPKRSEPTTLYLTRPDDRGYFMAASAHFERGNSIFQLTTTDGATGNFIVIDDDEVNRLALMMPTENLTRACTGDNIQISSGMHRIITDTAGLAALENGRWRIVKQARIHYEA